MSREIDRLEARIEALEKRLRRVEENVTPREPRQPSGVEPPTPARASIPSSPARDTTTGASLLSFAGRSLIVLGGAFMLRWLTQRETLPQDFGSAIGMVYALLWIVIADMAAGRDRRSSAAFHGVTGVMIALPLLVEATTKFHFLSPGASSIGLGAFVIIGLAAAGRRRLRILAWTVALPAAPLALGLAIVTQALSPFLTCLFILGFVTLWLGYLRGWQLLATLIAGAANFGGVLVVLDAIGGPRPEHAPPLSVTMSLTLLFSLILVYFGSFSFRVFRRKRTISPLEIGQSLVVVLIGLGGAAIVVNSGDYSMLPLGIGALVLSCACYTAAFGFLPRRDPNRRNFLFYTLLGLATAILGCELSFTGAVSATIIAIVAFLAGGVARRVASPVLFIHGAVFTLIAVMRSGLLMTTLDSFAGDPSSMLEWTSGPLLITLAVTLIYPWFPRPGGRAVDVNVGRRCVAAHLAVGVCAVGGVAVTAIASQIPDIADSPALLANIRTGVLVIVAVVVSVFSARVRLGNLAWLAYALLAAGAVKLAIEDVPAGGEATLFLSFGFYGGGLIAVPRLLRRRSLKAEAN